MQNKNVLNFKPERDLILINVLSVLLILVIFLFPNSPVRIILGLPFVLFFTGYVSISALFPRQEELDIIERLTFSTGLSIAITPLIGLILNYTSFGIRVYSLMFSLFSFILLVSIVAIYRRRIVSQEDVFAPLAPDRNVDVVQVENSNEVKSETRFLGNFFQKIKLEYIALPLFVALSLFVYHQNYFSYIFMVIAAAIGVLLFIVFNKYLRKEQEPILSFELPNDKSHTFRLVTSILFFIFFGLSFLTLLQGFYTKTVWYYIFISLCAGVLATEILFVKTKTQSTLNLIKSFLLFLNISLSNQILFPYGIGHGDTGYNIYKLTIPIVNNGYVPHIGGYEYFPCHSILVTINILITGADPRMLYLYLGGFVMFLGMLFVFLLGRKFVNLQFGLFAALIYLCSDGLISWASHPTHLAYTFPLALMIFAMVLYIYNDRDYRFTAFYIMLVTTIVFTHHYSAMIILIVLLSVIIVEIFQRIKDSNYQFKSLVLIQLYALILLAQWMYYSNMMGRFTSIFEAYSSAFAKGAESVITATTYDQLPATTLFLNTFGSSILIALSTVGFLYFSKTRSFFKNTVLMLTVILSILLGIGVILKEPYLLPQRLYPILQGLGLVFLASGAIIWLFGNSKQIKPIKSTFVIALIICLAFFSLSSTMNGFETSPFVGDQAYVKLYETPHEKYSDLYAETFLGNDSSIYRSSSLPLTKEYDINFQNIKNKSHTIFNQFDIKTGFRSAAGAHMGQATNIKFDKKVLCLFGRYNQYYDNGMVNVYYKP
jgi:MFS family permease